MRRPRALVLAALVAAALPLAIPLAVAAGSGRQEALFPHAEHEGLFPLCTGCHEGIPEENAAALYPEPASCAGCHDGVQEEVVEWTGPTPEPTNLDFRHDEHAAALVEAGQPAPSCESCHSAAGGPRMAVEPLQAQPDCLACHVAPGAPHYEDVDCTVCHVPLAESDLPVERIAALAVPEDHQSGAFVTRVHGELSVEEPARCATCHTQDRCLTCHVDADRPELAAIPLAPAGMALPAFAAHYPVPPSHRSPRFVEEHGALAGGGACATCHTRDDCTSCHVAPLPATAAELPARADVIATGALLAGARLPDSHASPFFLRTHGTQAASAPDGCATCHTEATCVACHDGAGEARFHPADFVQRHPASAYGRDTECAACHDSQVFCRACHVQQGFQSQGRLGPGYHDAEPLWLLRHGQAARQGLEGCASCHAQRDCTQCHSETGAFRVSPHGPGFDARRAWEASPGTCFACHLSNPLGGAR